MARYGGLWLKSDELPRALAKMVAGVVEPVGSNVGASTKSTGTILGVPY